MKMNRGKCIYLVAAVLLLFVYSSDAGVTDTTCTPNDDADGNAKCVKVDANAICPVDGTHCACKADFVLNPKDNTKCVQKITLVECTPNDQSNGDTKCQNVDANAECPTSTTKCACKAGYKGTDTCTKVPAVLEISCSGGNNDCTALHSECDNKANTPKCKCSDGYKQDTTDNSKCTAVLEGTCESPSDCTGTVSHSECSEQKKCQCTADYIEESHICKTALGKPCTDADNCVTDAKCETTCKCSPGFINTSGLCAPESSATSAWMTTSLIGTSLLTLVFRLI